MTWVKNHFFCFFCINSEVMVLTPLYKVVYLLLVKNVIRLNVDWCIAIHYVHDDKEFVVLNVYTPYESRENEDEYLHRLAFINSFIQDSTCSNIYVTGDMNADLLDSKSLFSKHMIQFSDDNNLILSSKECLPTNSYTYISEAWHTTSWLDHCISTADGHASLGSMEI